MERMNRIGTRKIDELGRIVFPSELRSKYGWGMGDTVAMYHVDDNTLMLQLAEKYPGTKCVFCGTTESATAINGKDVCSGCLEKIKTD